jgi:hypothetical protein
MCFGFEILFEKSEQLVVITQGAPCRYSQKSRKNFPNNTVDYDIRSEAFNYFDLRRWLLAEEYENKTAMGVEIIKNDDGSFTYNPIVVLERHFYPQHYWLPIPRDEITKSGGTLTQNPHYN